MTGGESAGRLLSHAQLARALVKLGEGTGGFRGAFPTPRRAVSTGTAEAVVFVQERVRGRILAVGTITLFGP